MALHFISSCCWKQHIGKLNYLRCFSLTVQRDNEVLRKSDFSPGILCGESVPAICVWYPEERRNRKRTVIATLLAPDSLLFRREEQTVRKRSATTSPLATECLFGGRDTAHLVPISNYVSNFMITLESVKSRRHDIDYSDLSPVSVRNCDAGDMCRSGDRSPSMISHSRLLPTSQYITVEFPKKRTMVSVPFRMEPFTSADCTKTAQHSKSSLSSVQEIETKNVKTCGTPISRDMAMLSYCTVSNGDPPGKNSRLPTMEQLVHVQSVLVDQLPDLFTKPHPFALYDEKQFVFENNFFGKEKVYKGLQIYILLLAYARMRCSLRFINMNLNLLNVTFHSEDGTVRIRWQIYGTTQMALLKRGLTPKIYRPSLDDIRELHDGFSIFHVNNKGLIVKHRLDKLMPDDELVNRRKSVGAVIGAVFGLGRAQVDGFVEGLSSFC